MRQFGIKPISDGINTDPNISGDWPANLSCTFQNVVTKDSTGHSWYFNGTVPLGETYCISTESPQVEIEALLGVWQTTLLPESGSVVLPPFVRVIVLTGA